MLPNDIPSARLDGLETTHDWLRMGRGSMSRERSRGSSTVLRVIGNGIRLWVTPFVRADHFRRLKIRECVAR